MKILVTGAGGFVGQALVRYLLAAGHEVTGTTRKPVPARAAGLTFRETGDLTSVTDFAPLVAGMEAIVHLAARVHLMHETEDDPLEAYRRANTVVTERLARAAAAAGTRHFVFMSSVKVNGEATYETPFGDSSPPAPEDPYARSKLEAEQVLAGISSGAMNCTSLRTPLIYGPGVKANFRALMRLCDTSLPLPLDGITGNRRSLLYLGNLTHAIDSVLTRDVGAGADSAETFLISDGEDLSTADLVGRLRRSFDRRFLPVPVPATVLRGAAALVGKSAAADRLCGSLRIDSHRFRDRFGWTPPFSVNQGLAATASRHRIAP